MTNSVPKKIYSRELPAVGKFRVWLVDGNLVRKEIDENFTSFDQHQRFAFIPPDEIWIDELTKPIEWPFFIERARMENRLMGTGLDYQQASAKAQVIERRERERARVQHTHIKLPLAQEEILKRVHKGLLQTFSNEQVKVWLVDGKAVRDFLLVDYAEGGHDLVYDLVPKGEIWLEDTMEPQERHLVLLHDLHERALMRGGKHYQHSHLGATIVEDYCRDHPAEIEAKIKEELVKNKVTQQK